jgi:hypothetical protein
LTTKPNVDNKHNLKEATKMSDLIKFPSHYTSGCSSIGLPIVEAIVFHFEFKSLRQWRPMPIGETSALTEGWELQECKHFVRSVEDSIVHRNLHQALSAIEYLWRAGLKVGEAPLQPLLMAQERLTPYPEFGEGTIVGVMLADRIEYWTEAKIVRTAGDIA